MRASGVLLLIVLAPIRLDAQQRSAPVDDFPWVVVSEGKKGFALQPSGKPFVPWGFNYDHDASGRLIEDYWETEWNNVEADFAQMKKLGANVVRVHLQFGKFMTAAGKPDEKALDRLAKLLRVAETNRLYLNLTGLGCYHKKDVPAWYDALLEAERWDAQARFWEAIAKRCVKCPAVFCYDLMNEPVVPGGKRKDGDWLGPAFGDKHFVQFVTLDQNERPRPDIARRWVEHLVTAIRRVDQRHLITVGLVDWSLDRKGLTSGFVPEKTCEKLDFVCVHLYPETGKLDEAAKTLKGFAIGKPVVVEETFPLKCSSKELAAFIEKSGPDAAGWISFYWGTPPDELRRSMQIKDAILVDWLERFPKRAPSTDWPRWRGPNADGVADGRTLPIKWNKTENVLWSVELPGWGTSSPVVSGDRVFVMSQVTVGGKKSLLTLCFDRTTGRELWRHDFGLGAEQKTHVKSNLAVNTPAVTADTVYVAFGNADIARYTHDGKPVWVRRYLQMFDDPKMSWGYSISPLVLDDSVLFPWNHHKGPCFVIGLDKTTGAIGWKKERPIGTAHATPLLIEHHGQSDILVPGQNRLTAFDSKSHAELWRYGEGSGPYNGEIISSPVYGDGMVFLQLWRESRIHAVRLRGDGKPPEYVWVSQKPGPVEPSLLYYRGLVYAQMDDGLLVALDGQTGKEYYRERLKGTFNSSPVAGNGHVYVSNNDGITFVVKAGKGFEVVATNDLGERITASPAITGDAMIYRTDSHLYCIGSLIR